MAVLISLKNKAKHCISKSPPLSVRDDFLRYSDSSFPFSLKKEISKSCEKRGRRSLILVNDTPLQKVWVKSKESGVLSPAAYTVTNNQGLVTTSEEHTDFEVYAQNSVVRIVDGANMNIAVIQRPHLRHYRTTRIPHQIEHFEILQSFKQIYDEVFRTLPPWHPREYPLSTKMDGRIIEVSYPSGLATRFAPFTEPRRRSSFFRLPLIHLRLGANVDQITEEFAHALHFSLLNRSTKIRIEGEYIAWMTSDLIQGGNARHMYDWQTNDMVAFIESFAHFACAYRETDVTLSHQQRVREFYTLFDSGRLRDLNRNRFPIDYQNIFSTTVNVEGAVMATLFVDYARNSQIGLDMVVRTFVTSNSLTLLEYAEWIESNYGEHSTEYTLLQDAITHRFTNFQWQ